MRRRGLVDRRADNVDAAIPLTGKLPQVRIVGEVEEHLAALAQHPGEPGVLVVDVQGSVGREGADERMRVIDCSSTLSARAAGNAQTRRWRGRRRAGRRNTTGPRLR